MKMMIVLAGRRRDKDCFDMNEMVRRVKGEN